jgi:chromosome segregation protein
MYFKKLELCGFKSFTQKTELVFEPGVTAIVGPNGCGKSNISDAIRWALGEQNPRVIRCARMEDVIFNGTTEKAPVNFVEVTLTLSNEGKLFPVEYEEVSISRRIFRDGQCEYFLNKTPVRLKDITELVAGTGIGTDSYSLIEQGKIDLILSSKPEERRFVFEEASGITKYKTKKKEAMRKLEQTDANLLRVNDIISEVSRQMNSIQRQVNKARRFREEFEKLRNLEIKQACFEYRSLCSKKEQLAGEEEEYKRQEEKLSSESLLAGKKLDTLQAETEEIDIRLNGIQAKQVSIEALIDKKNNKASMDRERLVEIKARLDSVSAEMEELDRKSLNLSGGIENTRSALESVIREKSNKEMVLAQRKENLSGLSREIDALQQKITVQKADLVDILSEQSGKKNELARVSANIQNALARLRRLEKEKDNVKGEISGVHEKYNSTQASIHVASDRTLRLSEEKKALDGQMSGIQDELQNLGAGIVSLQNSLAAKESKVEFLEEAFSKYEGFSAGVRDIMTQVGGGTLPFPGVRGLVADVVEVRHGFERAIESALGENVQGIIVDDIHVAREAMAYLYGKQTGRVKLFPVQMSLKEKDVCVTTPSSPKVLGRALEFVSVDEKYKPVLSILLEDVLIVEDTDTALELSVSVERSTMLVTPAGDVVTRNSITGGLPASASDLGLVGRKSKLKQLQEECHATRVQLESLNALHQEKTLQMKALREKIEHVDKMVHESEIELANLGREGASIEAEWSRLKEEHSIVEVEIEEILQERAELHSEEEKLTISVSELGENDERVHNLIASLQQELEGKFKHRETLLVEIAQMEASVESVGGRIVAERNHLSALEEEHRHTLRAFELRKTEITELHRRNDEITQEVESLVKEIQNLTAEKKIVQDDAAVARNNRDELAASLVRAQEEIRAIHESLEKIRSKIHECQLQGTELSYGANNIHERMREVYKVGINEIQLEIEDGVDWKEVSSGIAQLKSRIEAMGHANLGAIEEQHELEERLAFLTKEKSDLTDAREDLLKAITKINKTTRALFLETFNAIQVAFREFFVSLFGGGEAELVLMDEDDVLECGIEIIARPPGKKLQSITLLSGGEKSLTAIALLFAIFKVKPSPFCVLDEIDAALDEANIDRFTRGLQEFVKTSQFIIITHNKKTIGMADVIYGVTMEEPGISKVVSVKFKDREEEPVSVMNN